MKTTNTIICRFLVCALVGCTVFPAASQPVSVGIHRTNGQVTISWPPGLSLVQPQKRTNLTSGAWQNLGAATTASNLTETMGAGQGYYRLGLFAPTITAQPLGQTNSSGSNVTFNVTAAGTGPLTYQWRKDTTNLAGKTAASLGLTNLMGSDGGNYTVLVSNRVGAVTSIVAVLSVTNPLARPVGIYMGTFAGQADNGGFGVMLRSNGLAYVVGYNTPQDEGVYASGFSVATGGTFYTTTAQGGKVGGIFTANLVTGNFTNSTGQLGSYIGNRKADTGIHAGDVGYYAGTYSGDLSGTAYAVVAADGSVFFYTTGATGDGGGFGTINAANNFSATTVPDSIGISGTLNQSNHVLSGSYSGSYMGFAISGAFSLTRTMTP